MFLQRPTGRSDLLPCRTGRTVTDKHSDTGVHLHRLGLVIGMPKGDGRGGFSGIQPMRGQGGEEVMALALDRIFLLRDLDVPSFQLFMHEIDDERVFDRFLVAFRRWGFIPG
jgi:hypothetical protein